MGPRAMNGVFLAGASGIEYFYTPYLFAGTRWHPDPANYAFACLEENGLWRIDYIGETANLQSRMNTHSQWPKAAARGCTHVLVNLTAAGPRVRRVQERDLIARHQPVLNAQHLKAARQTARRMGYYPQGYS